MKSRNSRTFFISNENRSDGDIAFHETGYTWIQKRDLDMNCLPATLAGLDENMTDDGFYRWVIRWHCPNIHHPDGIFRTAQVGGGLVPVDGVFSGKEMVARDTDPYFARDIEYDEFIPVIDFHTWNHHLREQYVILAMDELQYEFIEWLAFYGPMIAVALNHTLEEVIWEEERRSVNGRIPGFKSRLPAGFDPTRKMPGIWGKKPSRIKRGSNGRMLHLRLV